MFNVKHDFGFIGRLFGVPRSWLSKVGAFCSSFSTRGRLININIPDNPAPGSAPIVFEIDEAVLRDFVIANAPDPGIPSNVLTSNDIGTTVAAKSHTHAISDVANLQTTLNGKASSSHNHDTVYAAKSHTHAISDVANLQATLNGKASSSHNHDTVYAAANHNHNGVYQPVGNYAAASHSHAATTLTATAATGLRFVVVANNATKSSLKTVTLSDLKYSDQAHSGTCLVIVDADGNVSHSGNSFYDALNALVAFFDATNKYFKSLAVYGSSPKIEFFLNGTSCTASISDTAYGLKFDFPEGKHPYLAQHPKDTDLTTTTTNGDSCQIATCGFVNGKLTASNPDSYTTVSPDTDTASGTSSSVTWTAGGSTGLAIKQLVRVRYVTTGTSPVLYGYYRVFRYDKLGRLYQITGESREAIDTTTLIIWN